MPIVSKFKMPNNEIYEIADREVYITDDESQTTPAGTKLRIDIDGEGTGLGLKDFESDSDHRTVTDNQINDWTTDVNLITGDVSNVIALQDNTEVRLLVPPEADNPSVEVTFPTLTNTDKFISALSFVSHTSPVNFICPSTVIFSGTDVTDAVFVPIANQIYNIIFYYDGYKVYGVVSGVAK